MRGCSPESTGTERPVQGTPSARSARGNAEHEARATRGPRSRSRRHTNADFSPLATDLGPTGVDSVFLGLTAEAVRAFQQEHRLDEDGLVGSQTWAKLVDAGFTLGDRMLYLRLPALPRPRRRAPPACLNVLGFACGANDGIFGAFTEGAVREFPTQRRSACRRHRGPDTVRTVMNLRHVWDGKDATLHLGVRLAPARAAEYSATSRSRSWETMRPANASAERVVNLAHATTACPGVRVRNRRPG